ncbi:bifunctional AP-4-A phosphorylase/ADP sulfurylase, partial [Ascosphaera aggregata]
MTSPNAITRLSLDLPPNLPALVAAKFREARQNKALTLSETIVKTVRSHNVPFLLQYCPALSKKPTPFALMSPQSQQHDQGQLPHNYQCQPQQQQTQQDQRNQQNTKQVANNSDHEPHERGKRNNPFENPAEELFISDVPLTLPHHFLILNKFPIIPEHFILATKQYKPQTHYLEQSDLEVTYAIIKAWENEGKAEQVDEEDGNMKVKQASRLFAFFNSGDNSGASQPHRHVQFLPIENMNPSDTDWRPLINVLRESEERSTIIPFCWYSSNLSRHRELTGDRLHEIYLSLLKEAIDKVKAVSGRQTSPAAEPARFEGKITDQQ